MSAEPGTRIPALDGLRGIAILLVLVMHFTIYGGPPPSSPVDEAFYQTAAAGWIGVDLFFVLSGFLITGILWDAKGGEGYFRGFYVRRCLRIFPLYYAALLIFLVLLPALLPEHSGLRAARQDAAWYWTYLSNLQIAREGWPAFGALGHFWSLAVEEQFYLVWPAVVFLLGRRALMAVCLGCVALCPLLRLGLQLADHATAAYTLTPARMDALAVGALLALAARGPLGLSRLSRRAGPTAAGLGLGLAALCAWRGGLPSEDPAVSVLGGSLLAGLFGALLALTVTSPAWSGVLSLPGLVLFGRYSYALYVLHHPLLFLKPEGLSASAFPQLWGSQIPGRLLFIAAATGLCLGLAWLSWHLLEKRFLELKDRFPYRAAGEKAPGAERVPAP